MSRGTAAALTVIRVDRGAPQPSPEQVRAALARDCATLHLAPAPIICDFAIAGPYPISIGDRELDEYVVWER